MRGYKVSIEVADRDLAHRLAAIIGEVFEPAPDAHAVFKAGPIWQIEAYYADPPPQQDDFAGRLGQVAGVDPPSCHVTELPDVNWVALSQAALPPVHGTRFTIFGQHDRDNVGQGPNAIQIDAGEAFGTAHHATTFGCLLAVERLTRPAHYKTVLDLGTGSGILAIALRRALPQARIFATDRDPQSVLTAADNARINRLPSYGTFAIRFLETDGLKHPVLRAAAPFDLIVANILAGPLARLAPEISTSLAAKGVLLLSGTLNEQACEVSAAYRAHGVALQRHDRIEGWSTLTLIRTGRK